MTTEKEKMRYSYSPGFNPSFVVFLIFCTVCSIILISSWLGSNPFSGIEERLSSIMGSDDLEIDDPSSIPYTDFSASRLQRTRQFWKSHKTNFQCPRKLKSLVGGEKGKGGKWLCGLENLGKRSVQEGYNCVVYSFGAASDSTFEAEILQTTRCSVYAYDPTEQKIGHPLKSTNPRIHFETLAIAGTDSSSKKTLKTLMDENGHKFIDILKIDVEGDEYESLEKMLVDFEHLPFGQLLVKLHNSVWTPRRMNRVIGLLKRLERRGSRIFSTEPNLFAGDCCSEFSFINLNYIDLFIPNRKKKTTEASHQHKN